MRLRVETRAEKGTGFAGQHHVIVPARVVATVLRRKPLLRGLLVAGAGYFPIAEGHLRRRPRGFEHAILIYCVKGTGWCEIAGRRHTVRSGDLLAVPAEEPHSYGAQESNPWTIFWAHLSGNLVPEYLIELGATAAKPVKRLGDDFQLALLFNEVVKSLEQGFSVPHLLHAAHAMSHLLALMIGHREPDGTSGSVEKVARCIVHMSEHLDQPLRVAQLAAQASLSAAHFTALFKEQTGCSPRDYLHLLRIHRACQLLHGTALPVKEIAARLGYQDQFHFSRQFKAFQGVAPTEFRASRVV
jgi:AraC family transcriptional regulator, arabinose operon regulatory protein